MDDRLNASRRQDLAWSLRWLAAEPVAIVVRPLMSALLIVVLAGCGSGAPTTRLLGPGERWLPVADWSGRFCAGGGFVGNHRLHGSPDDPRGAWMTIEDGSRRELVWLAGTSARFVPELEVIGPDGLSLIHI